MKCRVSGMGCDDKYEGGILISSDNAQLPPLMNTSKVFFFYLHQPKVVTAYDTKKKKVGKIN